eukprot:5129537-Amphidinium_carterae.1
MAPRGMSTHFTRVKNKSSRRLWRRRRRQHRQEKRYHSLTHYLYREWCEHCVRGRDHEDRHHTQREADQQGTPVVQLDYSFLTDGESQVPLLAAIDKVYHRTMAVWVPLKAADQYAVKSIRMFIQTLGLPNGIIQSDNEHSALAVSKVAVEPIVGWNTRQTPLNSKGSNGMAERLHFL